MKKFYPLVFALSACLFLSSCVVDSENPLSSPDTARADKRLIGYWHTESDSDHSVFHFTTVKGGWMHVEITETPPKLKPDSYDFFPTVIGDDTFLNVRIIGKDDQGRAKKSYVFLRYSISSDHVLSMWMMSQDKVAAAVRAGKLKGTVHQDKNPMMTGTPPHPDLDVALEESSANLVKFIQDSNADSLFDDKTSLLYQGEH